MDTIVFGPLIIRRHTLASTETGLSCSECNRGIHEGQRYGITDDDIVCDPCADRLEAKHS